MRKTTNNIEREIYAAMQECIGENEEVLESRAKDAASLAVRQLKSESRKRSGKYAKGWTSSVKQSSLDSGVEAVVHNKRYQLTHLLERDHKIKNQTGKTYGTARGDGVIERIANRVGRQFLGGDGS